MAKSTVKLRNAALDQVGLAIGAGLYELAKTIVERARPPDLPPIGIGLVQGGGTMLFVDGTQVEASTIGGQTVEKPRGIPTPKGWVVAIAGWGFPAHLVEFGSIHNTPRPFLTPAGHQAAGQGVVIVSPVIARKIAGIP